MAATTYSANDILNKEFGGTQFTPPANWFLALSTTYSSYSGSNVSEPTDPNYARVSIANTKANFSTATSGSVYNLNTISWPQSSGSFGTILEVDFFDASASSSSHLRHKIILASPRTVSGSSVFSLVPGALSFSLV
jgi:hypothetical protein